MVYICWCLLKYLWVYMHTSDPAIQGRSRVLESERGFSEISSRSGVTKHGICSFTYGQIQYSESADMCEEISRAALHRVGF